MVSAINSALSGLAAAEKRLAVSANNIANIQSTRSIQDGQEIAAPYQPQQVVQSSLSTGGVKSDVINSDRAPVKVFAPDNPDADESGFVSFPNIDQAEELINSQLASNDYKANLKSIKAQNNLFESLLDILA